MRLSEVVDSPESAKEFLDVNQIKQDSIVGIVVIWDEEVGRK